MKAKQADDYKRLHDVVEHYLNEEGPCCYADYAEDLCDLDSCLYCEMARAFEEIHRPVQTEAVTGRFTQVKIRAKTKEV